MEIGSGDAAQIVSRPCSVVQVLCSTKTRSSSFITTTTTPESSTLMHLGRTTSGTVIKESPRRIAGCRSARPLLSTKTKSTSSITVRVRTGRFDITSGMAVLGKESSASLAESRNRHLQWSMITESLSSTKERVRHAPCGTLSSRAKEWGARGNGPATPLFRA